VVQAPVLNTPSPVFRGEPAVLLPPPAGEGVQLSWTLLAPPTHHRRVPRPLPVHDDQVPPLLVPPPVLSIDLHYDLRYIFNGVLIWIYGERKCMQYNVHLLGFICF